MRPRQILAGTLLLLKVAGCTRMRSLETPGPYVETRRPGALWVRLDNGPEMRVESPRVISDTVFGFNMAGGAITLPLSQLEDVRVRELWVGPTIGLGVAGFAALVALAAFATGGFDFNGGETEDTLD